ncbi:OmpP1/FadL family transporter [Cupriavidus necator]
MLVGLSGSVPSLCAAATGIYLTGYGTQEQGMGGATIAVGQSAMAAANNPAGMAFVGERLDTGLGVLLPNSTTEANGRDFSIKQSPVPFVEFGYSHVVNDAINVGISSWASGGGTKYGSPFGGIPGNSATESQGVFVHFAPTVTYRIAERHALAFSFVGSVATFRLDGIEAQSGQANRGRDWEPGYGVKLGWLSQVTDQISFGAFYASKVRYSKFGKYSGILPNGGDLDEPEHWGVGVAFRPTERTLLAFDYLRYNYSNTKGFGNRLNFSEPLGSADGSGFGLRDVNVFRLGGAYKLNDRWAARAGAEFGQSPISSDNTAFTFLMPVTPDKTFTLGISYQLKNNSDISFAYAYSPTKRIQGTGASTGVNPETRLHYFAMSYSARF